ncbi:MAG: DUF6544 family protein [Chloroflexota bacterium]
MFYLALLLLIFSGAAVFVAVRNARFQQQVDAEIDRLLAAGTSQPAADQPATAADASMDHLPPLMRTYLERTLPPDLPLITSARLRQSGHMRPAPDQPWRPFSATQYFTTQPPGFVWRAQAQFAPGVRVAVRDTYRQQYGNMHIRLLSAFTIDDVSGPELAAGALIRYLAEMTWFPTAFLDPTHITWETVDDRTVRATMRDGDVTAPVEYVFDDSGDIVRITSSARYFSTEDDQPTAWFGECQRYETFNGVRIPAEVHVGWAPHTGSYVWWKGTIESIDYNVPRRYAD